ncbi:STAS domain-containing protein [Rossellomorea sp. YZS02]|uniref:STAS domain-containing protein n=1 Tax=Rossellomorea sp. YZS02 TaxID=3097358 RepID=UPI002A131CC3|nr:STAS domain-containing protein [Rossellomorea sp. YZS02]MDX8343510.1 STAS domain-containing protein [Rossellomorea sp. YZS02]
MQKFDIDVNGSLFDWDLEKGSITFENDEVVLFWVNTAFKTLIDSIEEIAGEKEARLVLETAGYRTGLIVSDFYLDSIGKPDEILDKLPNTYVTAGWGITEILSYSIDERKAVVQFCNGWEYKVNIAQGKEIEGTFMPGHWAGVLTGIFGSKMWYRVLKSQIQGDDCSVYEFFASDISPSLNVSALIEEQTIAAQEELERVTKQRTEILSEIIKEISSPIIPVLESILVVPLVGRYDEIRAEELLNKTLLNLPRYKAEFLIIDLTSLSRVDDYTLSFIQKFVGAASLLGTNCLLVGISSELSIRVTQSGYRMNHIPCFSLLQQGVNHALEQLGMEIVKKV